MTGNDGGWDRSRQTGPTRVHQDGFSAPGRA